MHEDMTLYIAEMIVMGLWWKRSLGFLSRLGIKTAFPWSSALGHGASWRKMSWNT
jgi:hypothetical protein